MEGELARQLLGLRPKIDPVEWAYDEVWASLRYYMSVMLEDEDAYWISPTSPRFPDFVGGLMLGRPMQDPIFAALFRRAMHRGAVWEERIAREIEYYFSHGIKVVWDIDVVGDQTIRVIRCESPTCPVLFLHDEKADAEPVLPSFRIRIDELLR